MNVKNVFTPDLHLYTEYQHFLIQNALERSLFKTYTFRVTKKVLSYKIYIFIIYSRACIEVLCLRLNKMGDLGSCPCALFKVWKAFRSLQPYSMKQDFPAQKLVITVTLEATYMTMRLAVLECSFSSSFSLIWRLVWKAKQTGWNMQVSTYSITIRGR